MKHIIERANRVFDSHPPAGDRRLSINGSNWLWAVTAFFLFTFLVIVALSIRPRHKERIFHYIWAIPLLAGAIAYYAMASDLGWVVVRQSHHLRRGLTRQIFWPKYVYWIVAFPAAILALGLLSGVTWATIAYGIGLSWIWVICYLIAAFTSTRYKWGFFALGTLAWLILFIGSFTHGRRIAARNNISGHYTLLSGWLHLLWLLYPIAWGLSDGGNVIGVTSSFIFFGILDVLMIPILAYAFIGLSKSWDYGRLGLNFTRHGRGYTGPYDEKREASSAIASAPATATTQVPASNPVQP